MQVIFLLHLLQLETHVDQPVKYGRLNVIYIYQVFIT